MKFNQIASGCLVAIMAMAPAEKALASGGDLIGGLIVGGLIGAAIANDQHRRRAAPRTGVRRSSMSTAQREANREVQTSLNYFNYPVGTPDGSIGPKSRAAISQYQVLLGYPATGELTEYERTVLVTTYHRAIAGGPQVAQIISTHPQGVRGLLMVQRDEMAGISPQYGATAGVITPIPTEPASALTKAPTLPVLAAEPAAPTASALPSFMGSGATQVSLASQCNKISLMTNTNGGYTTAAAMTDANFALGEQFCLARTYAMAAGEDAAAKVAGFTPAQIAEQCKAFGPALKDQVASLSLKPRDDVLASVSSFVLTSGMAPAQLAGTAKICLGVGYTTDAMDVAIGSALLLTALGEKPYAELLGHHLSQGFGAASRPDLALSWYEYALDATQTGASVFAPGLEGRSDLIRKAAYTINGRSDLTPPAAAPLPVLVAPSQMAVAPAAAPLPVAVASAAPAAPVVVTPVALAPATPVAANDNAAPGLNLAGAVSFATKLFGN